MPSQWKWVRHDGGVLRDVGVLSDGSLHNPNGYDEVVVREAIHQAEERWHIRRSDAARRAVVTRRRRQERKILEIAKGLVAQHHYGPRKNCIICGKGMWDAESIARGIGSECWQRVLESISRQVDHRQEHVAEERP